MQYMWAWRLYGSPDKVLSDGRPVRILNPGKWNTSGGGPDFFNAQIRVEGITLAGNVELHIRPCDWHRHGHDSDRTYDSVILHVTGEDGEQVHRTDGSPIPQLTLPFDTETAARYRILTDNFPPLRCRRWLPSMPALHRRDCTESMAMERLAAKADRLMEWIQEASGDWAQGVFVMLARALGFGRNSDLLERTARTLSLSTLGKHLSSTLQLEALLMGQAGLLHNPRLPQTTYAQSLCREYDFLSHKFHLSPVGTEAWRHGGMRPSTLPYRTLALLARILQKSHSFLPATLISLSRDGGEMHKFFDIDMGPHWSRHYTLAESDARPPRHALGKNMIDSLIINVVAPLVYADARDKGSWQGEEQAVSLLRSLPCEHNHIVRTWEQQVGFTPENAFDSQGLIQLRKEYCDPGRCLQCRFGHHLLSHASKTP